MSDKEKLAHDLALMAAAISSNRNFEIESKGSDPDERRKIFADSLRQEYEFFFNYYLSTDK